MALFDQADFRRALDELNPETQRSEIGPTKTQSLGRLTIMGLIFNRMIGSGIFVTPAIIIRYTGSVGVSIILWIIGGIFALCGLYLWLEFGLSTPRHTVGGERLSVPRSGGEKNYLEYVYSRPERLTTCMFGIAFVILGNRAGNAYAFGIYVMRAAGYDDQSKGAVIGIAIAGLAFTAALHMFTRSGGVLINNLFGFFKAGLLLAIIIIGAIKASGRDLGGGPSPSFNNWDGAFASTTNDAVAVANSFTLLIYAYAGFEQPFYVLSEFRRPRKWFAMYTTIAIVIITALFVGINVVYLYVVPLEEIMASGGNVDIATLFMNRVFGDDSSVQKAMSALIAVSILGNLVVTTFTMSRVKQEIAKEGILPWSLFWATSHTTPAAKIGSWFRRNILHKPAKANLQEDYDHQEQSPMAALMLNLLSALILIAVTAFLKPYTAYQFLVALYTYSLVVIVGIFVAGGMLVLKFVPRRKWASKTHFKNTPKIVGLLPATFYLLVCLFLFVTNFIPPARQAKPPYAYYIVPVIGLTSPFWGVIWWFLLHLRMRITNTRLIVSRVPYVVPDPDTQGEFIQKAELIDHEWHSALRQRRRFGDEKAPNVRVNDVEYDDHSRDHVDPAEPAYHPQSNYDQVDRDYYTRTHMDRNDVSYQPRYNHTGGADIERSVSRSPNFEQMQHSPPNHEQYSEYDRNWGYANGGADMYGRDRR